ncbi:MAG TPA: hypothetical protein VL997_12445, partial [Dyella sp.]|nr:hypothetical protein [Dyella sp.]
MNSIRIRRSVLASSLALALFAPFAVAQTSTTSTDNQQQSTQPSSSQTNPSNGQSPNQNQAKKLQAITVTGSMIPRVEV